MKPRKELILAVTLVVAAGLIGMRFLRGKAQHHRHEKITGDASFDAYADGPRIHVLILRQHGDHQVLLYKKIENGNESTETELPHAAGEKIISRRSNDVRVAARGNHILALWQIAGTGYANRGPLRAAESTDGGKTWKSAPQPLAPGRTDDQGFVALMADRNGKFQAVWLDLDAKLKGLRHASYDSGVWSKPATIDTKTCECCWNTLKENPAGDLLVLYRNAKPRDMALAKFSAGAWQKAGIVDNFDWRIEACPHAGGGLASDNNYTYAVTWTGHETAQGAYFNRKKNSDNRWSLKTKLGGKSARNPDIVENSGRIAVVWDEFEGERRLVKVQTSANAGVTWTKAEMLTGANVSGSYPRIVGAAQGFTAFWSETQNGRTAVRFKKL